MIRINDLFYEEIKIATLPVFLKLSPTIWSNHYTSLEYIYCSVACVLLSL